MTEPARKISPAPYLAYAHVQETAAHGCNVLCDGQLLQALTSASCLMRPSVGDEVLVSLDATGRCFILSVLLRSDPDAATDLDFPGQVNLRAPEGGVALMAKKNLTLAAGEECSLMSAKVNVLADDAEVRVERLNLLGRVLEANLKAVRAVAGRIETTADRLTQRVKDLFCYVEEHSEHQAGSARHVVEETLTMHSKNAYHVADEIVKVDAEQVHLG